MKKEELLQKISKLYTLKQQKEGQPLNQIESLLKNYLKIHPRDTEMWLRLATLELTPPWEDPFRIQGYLKKILAYDAHNILATLFLAYIEYLFFSSIKEETFHRLSLLETRNLELLSMIEYAKALYYEEKNEKKYEQHLQKSIEYCNTHVRNYENLAELCLKRNQNQSAKIFLQNAINNIQQIYSKTYRNEDITDVNEFFNYYYKGTHTTEIHKARLEELLGSIL